MPEQGGAGVCPESIHPPASEVLGYRRLPSSRGTEGADPLISKEVVARRAFLLQPSDRPRILLVGTLASVTPTSGQLRVGSC